MEFKTLSLSLLTIACLQGCGGGSSNDSNTNQSLTPSNPGVMSITVNDTDVKVQQSVELLLHLPSDNITNIQWQQTSGEPVELYAKNSKVVAFTPQNAGDYGFQVTFNASGESQTLETAIDVGNETSPITARLGHQVAEQNKVSLTAFYQSSINSNSLTWSQRSGPTISLDNSSGQSSIYFDAPQVSQDQVIELEVSASDNSGNSYSDTVSILVENKTNIANNAYFDERLANVYPYQADSPYAGSLVDCTYSNSLTSSCTLSKLPLIAHDSLTPTVDEIMDRVVVSHPWMGDRFKAFLEQNDPHDDFKRLLRATTAVVISYDIRPAFYWAATGAIYLDPDYLWLTAAERDTINQAPDYRSSFGESLQFEMLWRYVKDNDYASSYFPINARFSRQQSDTLYDLGYLLYHELAHANDYLPNSLWSQLTNSNDRILDAALDQSIQSDILDIRYPLSSQVMKDLAQARYRDNVTSPTQEAYLPADIQSLFEPDGAVYFYSYSSLREDYAMLFEELMMYSRYGISRDIAITNNPPSGASGNDYIIQWGQRGRAAEQQIRDRMIFATQRVLPEFDALSAANNLPETKALTPGQNWIESINVNQIQPFSLASKLLKRSASENNRKNHDQPIYYHKPLPKEH